MRMFVQLLLFTCACALGAADKVPPYDNIYSDVQQAHDLLKHTILSMEPYMPEVDDFRRHYAEIIHVIHDEANQELGCLKRDYYKEYQKNINKSGPFAIANPQSVVDEVKSVTERIFNGIQEVVQLINAHKGDNEAVNEEINKNIEKYKSSKDVFLATGIAAKELLLVDELLDLTSDVLRAHNFVITSAPELKNAVMALKNLYQLLYRPYGEKC